jgi:hypothetical protein
MANWEPIDWPHPDARIVDGVREIGAYHEESYLVRYEVRRLSDGCPCYVYQELPLDLAFDDEARRKSRIIGHKILFKYVDKWPHTRLA